MQSSTKTVQEYIDSLPDDRKESIQRVRQVILDNLPNGCEEVFDWGMITYQVPLKVYSDTYNKKPLMYLALGSQKNYMVLYMMAVYGNDQLEAWFKDEYSKSGHKLDMGKSCLRFKNLDDLPLDLVGETVSKVSVDDFVERFKSLGKK